jgi:aminopeptidase YwaD
MRTTINLMKKQLFSLLLLLSLALGVAAQNASESAQNLRKHVEYLASDQFEGRRTGEQGATGAAGYVANMFAQVKLKAGYRLPNGKGTFMQPFPFITGVEPAATGNSTLLELNGADGKRARIDNLPGIKAVGFSPNADLSGVSIIFAGYGITSAEAKYDDYADLDVRGKIILIFDGTPENDNPHSLFGRFDARTKALIARDKGAAGVLLISR